MGAIHCSTNNKKPFIPFSSEDKRDQHYCFQSAHAELTSLSPCDHVENGRKMKTYLVIPDPHTSCEGLMCAAPDLIRDLALMNVIHHLVSSRNDWLFGFSVSVTSSWIWFDFLFFWSCITTNRMQKSKWMLSGQRLLLKHRESFICEHDRGWICIILC